MNRAAGLARLPNQYDEPVFYEVGLAVELVAGKDARGMRHSFRLL
jgi:hypothetical protein